MTSRVAFSTRPLTRRQFDRLSAFLDAVPDGEAMTIEEMDGFFCALIVGPDTVLPSEYLPCVLGTSPGESRFESPEEAEEILGLLTRYWNAQVSALHREGFITPVFDEPDARGVMGRAWARGFVQGMAMRERGWQELIVAHEPGELLTIAMVAGAMDPNWPPRKLGRKKTHEVAMAMASAIALAHEFFQSKRSIRGAETQH